MASYTPILGLPEVAPNQDQKETTINTALAMLEAAMNDTLSVDLSAGNVTLNAAQFTQYFHHEFTGNSVARTVTVPNTKRWFSAENKGTATITITTGASGSTPITLGAGKIGLIVNDGTNVRFVVPDPAAGTGVLSDLSDVTGTPSDGQLLRYNATDAQWEPWSFSLAFSGLTDFPGAYGSNASKLLAVNAAGNGLTWTTVAAASSIAFTSLTDVPTSYSGQNNRTVKVNSAGSGLVFAQPKLTEAIDFVSSYSGLGGKLLRVNAGATAVETFTPTVSILSDGPGAPSVGTALQYLRVKSDGSGWEYANGTGGPDHFYQLADVPASYTGSAGKLVIVNPAENGLIYSTLAFTKLSDVPANYTGAAGKFLQVNTGATGLQFGMPKVSDLSDGPGAPASNALKVVRVNAGATGLEYYALKVTDLGLFPTTLSGQGGKFLQVKIDESGLTFGSSSVSLPFTGLTDTPTTYSGSANKMVVVNSLGTGLTFVSQPATPFVPHRLGQLDDVEDGTGTPVQGSFLRWIDGVWQADVFTVTSSGGGGGVASSINANFGTHTYWRVLVHSATQSSNNTCGIAELQFRATPGGANQTSGGTAIAANTYAGTGFDQTEPFDGNASTFWATNSIDTNTWIGYQFAAPVSVAEVSIQNRPSGSYGAYAPTSFDVQFSDDGTNWFTAWSATSPATWGLSETRVFTATYGFTSLPDVPHSYTGAGGKLLRVKADLTGLEFHAGALADLVDIDESTGPTDGQALVWNAASSKWKPGSVASGGGGGSGGSGTAGAIGMTRVQLHANASIANNTFSPFSWASSDIIQDDVSAWASANPTRFTTPAGYVRARITVTGTWAQNSGGVRWAYVTANGTSSVLVEDVRVASNEGASSLTSEWLTVTSGDYLEVFFAQTSGGALNLTGATGALATATRVQVEWSTSTSPGGGVAINTFGGFYDAGVPRLSAFTQAISAPQTLTENQNRAISFSTTGNHNLDLIYKSAPTAPYRLVTVVNFLPLNVNNCGFGIGFYDPATGKAQNFYILNANGPKFAVENWNSRTAFNATVTSGAIEFSHGQPVIMGIYDDGTNIHFQTSVDGANFIDFYSFAKASGFLADYTHLTCVMTSSNIGSTQPVTGTLTLWDENGLNRLPMPLSGGGYGSSTSFSAGVAPVYRGTTTSGAITGTSATVALPAGSVAGDFLVFMGAGGNIAYPTSSGNTSSGGWSKLLQSGGYWCVEVFTRTLTSADITTGNIAVTVGSAFVNYCSISTFAAGAYVASAGITPQGLSDLSNLASPSMALTPGVGDVSMNPHVFWIAQVSERGVNGVQSMTPGNLVGSQYTTSTNASGHSTYTYNFPANTLPIFNVTHGGSSNPNSLGDCCIGILAPGGSTGGGGSSSLAGLSDVNESTPPTDGQYLKYNGTTGLWTPGNASATVFGTGAPSTLVGEGTVYFDTSVSPYAGYVQHSGAWVPFGPPGQTFDAAFYVEAAPTANERLIRLPFTRASTFAANFAGSVANASTAATGTTVFNVLKNGTSIGSITFAAGGTTGTFASSGGAAVSFASGDYLDIVAPATADATLKEIGISLKGVRN